MKKMLSVTAGTIFSFIAGGAGAQPFANEGQIVVSSDFYVEISSTSHNEPGPQDPDSTTVFRLAPALDYFFVESFSIGGQLLYGSSSDGDTTDLGIGPRVGYGVPFNSTVSFFPRLGFFYFSSSSDDGTGGTTDTHRFTLNLFAPFQFHPAEHFFIGIGPDFSKDLSAKRDGDDIGKDTRVGVKSVVGGYFGG